MYNTLSTEELIILTIDFVKVGQVLPSELKSRLVELELLEILDPTGATNEDMD